MNKSNRCNKLLFQIRKYKSCKCRITELLDQNEMVLKGIKFLNCSAFTISFSANQKVL